MRNAPREVPAHPSCGSTGMPQRMDLPSGARLQRALINFFLDEARAAGYEEIMPPTVVNAADRKSTRLNSSH